MAKTREHTITRELTMAEQFQNFVESHITSDDNLPDTEMRKTGYFKLDVPDQLVPVDTVAFCVDEIYHDDYLRVVGLTFTIGLHYNGDPVYALEFQAPVEAIGFPGIFADRISNSSRDIGQGLGRARADMLVRQLTAHEADGKLTAL